MSPLKSFVYFSITNFYIVKSHINNMQKSEVIQHLDQLKKQVFNQSLRIEELSQKYSSIDTSKLLENTKLDRIERNQEELLELMNTLSKRISTIQDAHLQVDDRVDDIDTKMIIVEDKVEKIKIEASGKSLKQLNSNEYNTILDKVSEIKEHFNSEIANVYDRMYSEILDLKNSIENSRKAEEK